MSTLKTSPELQAIDRSSADTAVPGLRAEIERLDAVLALAVECHDASTAVLAELQAWLTRERAAAQDLKSAYAVGTVGEAREWGRFVALGDALDRMDGLASSKGVQL